MKEGEYTYYVIQHRLTSQTPWGKPQLPLEEKTNEWSNSSIDWIGYLVDGTFVDYMCTFNTVEESFTAVGKLTEASLAGKLDYYDRHAGLYQRNRYQFRVVKITMSKKTEII